MNSKFRLYGIDNIDANEIDDKTFEVLRKILGIKTYLKSTKKINDESACVIAIAITMLNTDAPFPFQIDNWKKYIIDFLQVDIFRVLENYFEILYKKSKHNINTILEVIPQSTIENKPYKDKKLNLFKFLKKDVHVVDYSFKDLSKKQLFDEFKNNYRAFIDYLDDGCVPLMLMKNRKKIDTIQKRIIYFLIRIGLSEWNTYIYKKLDLSQATKFMLALENKKLKKNVTKYNCNAVENINSFLSFQDNFFDLESKKLINKIYLNEKYSNTKQVKDKISIKENKYKATGPNEKIKKSIKNGGLKEITCEVYSNNVLVPRNLFKNETGKYIWNLMVLVDDTIQKVKFIELNKNIIENFEMNNYSNESNCDITLNNFWMRKSSYREKLAIINLIFEKYINNPNIALLLDIMKFDDPYAQISEYIDTKAYENNISVKAIDIQDLNFNFQNVLKKID